MRRRLYTNRESIVGLDLSLTGTAACALPIGWNHDMYEARTMKSGEKLPDDAPPEDKVKRLQRIVSDVVSFCEQRNATHVFVEGYAFSARHSRAHSLGELGGVIKKDIYEDLGIVVIPVVVSRARKILLQKVPRADSKKFTSKNVKRLAGPVLGWTDDEIDSFVCANAGIMLTGGVAMTFEGTW